MENVAGTGSPYKYEEGKSHSSNHDSLRDGHPTFRVKAHTQNPQNYKERSNFENQKKMSVLNPSTKVDPNTRNQEYSEKGS